MPDNILKTKFDEFLKYIPAISLAAVFLASYDLYTYYHYFNIDIFSYIGVSEILIKSSTRLASIMIELVLALMLNSWTTPLVDSASATENPKMRKRKFLLFIALTAIILSVLLVFPKFYHGKNLQLISIEQWVRRILFLSMLLNAYWFGSKKEKIEQLTNPKTLFASVFVFLSIWVIISTYIGSLNTDRIKNLKEFPSKPNQEYTLTSGTAFNLGDSLRYLGKTDSYYFMWDKKLNSTIILPSSDIKFIKIFNSIDSINLKE